ncbi:MAG: hypothetical protein WBB29_05015 [Geitlerinemataceae cyanobacterium]
MIHVPHVDRQSNTIPTSRELMTETRNWKHRPILADDLLGGCDTMGTDNLVSPILY